MTDIAISIQNLCKTYNNGFKALNQINLEVRKGEIFALLGPNGAGKTTLISTVCGIVQPTSGEIKVMGFDTQKNFRQARAAIGLVPQELTTDTFETVWNTVSFTRSLYGKPKDSDFINSLLASFSLLEKKNNQMRTLSGGMKRRTLIAKALSHEPDILFLDEPTAGVDVELRKSMWNEIRKLQQRGVTVILTTHYIEEAEEMADRIGIINNGELILIREKAELMKSLGKKELVIDLLAPLDKLPSSFAEEPVSLSDNGLQIIYTYNANAHSNGVLILLDKLRANHIQCKDLITRQSSLEDIFVELVKGGAK